MTADDFRQLYDYHFALNRRVWDQGVMSLTDAQFTQKLDYSVGSIRNQIVHLMDIEDRWFKDLRGEPVGHMLNVVHFHKRQIIRERWDGVEARLREYLTTLRDETLQDEIVIQTGHKKALRFTVWQCLIHVINHGTDHRAQTLAMLHLLGVETFPQDFATFILRP